MVAQAAETEPFGNNHHRHVNVAVFGGLNLSICRRKNFARDLARYLDGGGGQGHHSQLWKLKKPQVDVGGRGRQRYAEEAWRVLSTVG
jgi:hypothetical protein